RRKQLRIAAIAGHVVDVDLGTAIGTVDAAVLRVDAAQHAPALVHLERFPRIEHRAGGEERGVVGFRGIAHVDRTYAVVRSRIRLRRTDRRARPEARRRRAVISAYLLVFALAFSPLCRLPVRAVAAHLTEQLQVAAEALKTAGLQAHCNRHLALQTRFR